MDFEGVETLEESKIAQRVWEKLKEEIYTLSFSVSPIFISFTALIEFFAWLEDGYSKDFDEQRIIPLRDDPFMHWSRWRPLMLTFPRIGRF